MKERRREGKRKLGPADAPPPPASMPLHWSSVGEKGGECKGVAAEEEGERATGGPLLTREPNRLPPIGSGLDACPLARRARAPGSGTHRRRGSVWWGLADRATAAVKKRREEEEAEEEEEKGKEMKKKRKERKKGWLSMAVGTRLVAGGQPTLGRIGGNHPFFLSFHFCFLFLILLPPLLLLPTVSSSLRRWHGRPGKADRTPPDAAPAPVVAIARGSSPAR